MAHKQRKKIIRKGKTDIERGDVVQKAFPQHDDKSWNTLLIILMFSFVTVIYIIISHFIIKNAGLNTDESFYMMAAKEAISGKIPYRDFGYSQTPILPYINGILMEIFGFTQSAHRVINSFWGFLALLISMIAVLKRKNLTDSFICGWVLVTSPYWIGFMCFSPFAAASLFMALTAMTVVSGLPYRTKVILFSLFGILAIGCRLTVAPSIIILWAYLFYMGESTKEKVIALISFALAGLIIIFPFFHADPENFIFWTLKYHLSSQLVRRLYSEHVLMLPSIFIIAILGMFVALKEKIKLLSPEIIVLLAGMIGILAQMILKCNYAWYSMPFVPMCAIGSVFILANFKMKKYLYVILIIFPVIYFTPLSPIQHLPVPIINRWFLDDKWANTFTHAQYFLREQTKANGYVLTAYPLLALQTDRKIFDGMEMGMFGVTDEMNEAKAQRLHLMHFDEMIRIVKTRKADAIIFNNLWVATNFTWSVPGRENIKPSSYGEFVRLIKENYRIRFVEEPLVILLPKS